MYLRTVRAKGAEGVELEYIRLVEAYWENGRSKQRVIANLGHKDLLAPHLESLIELLSGAKKIKSSSAIAHHVFDGSLRDSATVEMVLKDLQERFGLRRVIFVGDRGMVTIQNLALLRQRGQGYLVGLKRRRNEQVDRYIQAAAQGPWQDCPVGITAMEREKVPARW